jgi:hypothetical protein
LKLFQKRKEEGIKDRRPRDELKYDIFDTL